MAHHCGVQEALSTAEKKLQKVMTEKAALKADAHSFHKRLNVAVWKVSSWRRSLASIAGFGVASFPGFTLVLRPYAT